MTLSPEAASILRHDVASFVHRCFREINANTPFDPGEHIDVLASRLQRCTEPGTRLVVNTPPRHLKSLIVSIALTAWLLGHDPSCQIVCVSYPAYLTVSKLGARE